MESNQTTLDTYQKKFNSYIAGTVQHTSGSQKEWIDSLLNRVEKDSPILEIGSAFGRDASYIKDNGYTNLTVTDAFDAAVDEFKNRGFEEAKKLNVLTDGPDGNYDLIFASAVFLHFNEREFESVVTKLHSHLGSRGLLAFTVKEGEGEEWSNAKMDAPRYFRYWQEAPLRQTVEKCGYKVLEIVTNEEFSQKWLAVTCQPDYETDK